LQIEGSPGETQASLGGSFLNDGSGSFPELLTVKGSKPKVSVFDIAELVKLSQQDDQIRESLALLPDPAFSIRRPPPFERAMFLREARNAHDRVMHAGGTLIVRPVKALLDSTGNQEVYVQVRYGSTLLRSERAASPVSPTWSYPEEDVDESPRGSSQRGGGGGGGGGLRAVDVSGNQIGRRGGERLAAVFEVHDARLPGVLDLGWNDLGPAGPALLAAALNAPRLRRLAVPFNGLADVWETYLKHSSLIHLDISRNRLGPETAQGIATALKENHNLQVLMIGWNPLGTEGTNALLQSLEENKTLEILRVENTCDDGQEAAAVEHADEIMLRREILTTIVCEYPERERARAPAAAVRPPRASLLARLPAGVAAELASPRLSRMTECSPRK